MDTVESKIERPLKVNYHISEWFDDTHVELIKVVSKYMEQT